MATFLFLVQLLCIGTLIIPAYTETAKCDLLVNASASNLTVSVTPQAYKANTTYQVTISNDRNHIDSRNVTEYLLQALSPQNESIGEWKVDNKELCRSIDTAVLNATQNAINWTSPNSNSNITSAEIRVYIIFTNNSVEFKSVILNKVSETTTAPLTSTQQHPTTTPDSVSTVQSSSFFIAVIQLLLLLVTSKLLS